MSVSRRNFYRLAFLAVCFFIYQVSALSAKYCSDLNTASTNKNWSIFQSNGLCHDFCLSSYAFAVVQGDGCWCSNYVPGSTTLNSDCDEQCPGYPGDLCGGDGVYGYIPLSKAPLGIVGGSTAVSTSAVSTSDMPNTTSTVAVATTLTSSKSSSSSSTTWMPTPATSLATVTDQVSTVTVTSTVPANSQSLTEVSKKSGGGLSLSRAVGLTIGLVALIAILCWIIYSRIRNRLQEKEYNNASRRGCVTAVRGPVPSRSIGENSRYVLGTDGRHVVEIWEPEICDAPGSRRNLLMPVDPRLDPFAPVYHRGENKSQESVNTIQDDHDYSRRVYQQALILRATNPDGWIR